jgi:hypothetical protein
VIITINDPFNIGHICTRQQCVHGHGHGEMVAFRWLSAHQERTVENEAVAEFGMTCAPDELLNEKRVAFVHLHKHFTWSKGLEKRVDLITAIVAVFNILFTQKGLPKQRNVVDLIGDMNRTLTA